LAIYGACYIPVQVGIKYNTGKKGKKVIFFTGINGGDSMKLRMQKQGE
jgi:hypothetical protein